MPHIPVPTRSCCTCGGGVRERLQGFGGEVAGVDVHQSDPILDRKGGKMRCFVQPSEPSDCPTYRMSRNYRYLRTVLVPLAGLEPALLAELDFESSASTNFTTGARGRSVP